MKLLRAHQFIFTLTLIACLAIGLRFYRLEFNPPGLYWDEISIAYNAYSILTHGIDEHGTRFPVTHFLAYGDAKPPLYIYAASLSMALFGANDWAVRFPSALAGVVAVLLSAAIAMNLTEKLGLTWIKNQKQIEFIGLLTALLVAISPWHLQLSRAAFEANLGLTLFLGGLAALLYAPKWKPLYVMSSVFFVATWYTFNAYRLFVPPFLILCLMVFWAQLRRDWRHVVPALATAILLTAPLIPFVLSPQAQLRFNEVSIFNDLEPVLIANSRQEINGNELWTKLVHNRRLEHAKVFLEKFTDHLKPDYLFFSGDPTPRLSVKDFGVLYLIDLPLLIIGLYATLRATSTRIKLFLLGYLIFAIFPGAVARDTPHALRTLQVIPLPQLLVALGISDLFYRFSSKSVWSPMKLSFINNLSPRALLTFILVTGYTLTVVSYLHLYYVNYSYRWADAWQYGYRELMTYVESVYNDYDRIYMTDALGRPHSYVLWYLKYDTLDYLSSRDAGSDDLGFTYTNSFDKFYFGNVPSVAPAGTKSLIIDKPGSEFDEHNYLKVIYNPQGKPLLIIRE